MDISLVNNVFCVVIKMNTELKKEFYRLWNKWNGHYDNRGARAARGRIALLEFMELVYKEGKREGKGTKKKG